MFTNNSTLFSNASAFSTLSSSQPSPVMSANTTKTASVWKNNFHPTPQDWKSPPAAVFVPQKPLPPGSVPKNAKLSPVLKNFHPPPHDWKSPSVVLPQKSPPLGSVLKKSPPP